MVDVLPKVQGVDDIWATNQLPHHVQMNLQFCGGNNFMGPGESLSDHWTYI